MQDEHTSGLATGFLVAAILTAALVAVSSGAAFDIFDWVARALPGPVITFAIHLIVTAVRSLAIGPTAEVAKTVEQAMAILGMWLAGTITGGALFALFHLWRVSSPMLPGALGGVAFGLVALVSRSRTVADAAWILGTFLVWGLALAWSYRRIYGPPPATRVDRRRFILRLGAFTAAGALLTVAIERILIGARRRPQRARGAFWSDRNSLPNAGARPEPAPGSRPEFTPVDDHYRIDINSFPPEILPERWRLRVVGLVGSPREMTLEELRDRYAPLDQFVTLSCISNPVGGDLIGTQRWTGVSLQGLLRAWDVQPSATHLKIRSADGFFEIVAIQTIDADDRVMLTYAWDGAPLTRAHGFPLRLYVPNRYGMKQPKWIESIEAIDRWEAGYWVERGWSRDALVRATAVIDTSDDNVRIIESNAGPYAPIGGIAYAGSRGISKVEVQVDGGEWQDAQLRAPLSSLTWVLWRLDWPVRRGRHTFTVRCYDGAGMPQIAETASMYPSGATGLHSQTITF